MKTDNYWPILGCGVGLRAEHYAYILAKKPKVDWFEAVTENFMDSGGRPLEILTQICKDYPVALHGVALSIGSADPLDENYLKRLKTLVDRVDPCIVSDHLCWSGVEGESLHDLLPLPFTEEAVDFTARRIQKVQDFLGRKILIENVSTYVTYRHSTMPEWQFLTETARRAGCGILLDLNNIYVNSKNHHFDAEEYIQSVPAQLVGQFHLGGHTDKGEFLFDTHSAQVVHPVWQLYEKALALYGPVSTLIEWDADIPEFSGLLCEAEKAKQIYQKFNIFRPLKKAVSFSPKKYTGEISHEEWKKIVSHQRRMKNLVRPGSTPADEGDFLNPQGSVSGRERMSVYAGGYVARIRESLAETYEAVKHVMGEDAFTRLAESYAQAYPSHSYNLSDASKELPTFLEQSTWKDNLPFLPDLARLERLIAESFHSFAKSKFDVLALAGLDEDGWNNLRIEFQPFVKIISSPWPIVDLWTARKTPISKINVTLEGRPQCALVYRREFEVFCRPISGFEYEFLKSFFSGKTLGQACEHLSALTDEDLPLQDWLAFWSSNSLFADAVPRGVVQA